MSTTLADVHAAVKDLTGRDRLYQRLARLITEQGTVLESSIGSHRKHQAAPIPWNEPAAMLYMDIHAGAREHEANLTMLLWRRAKYRGTADALTVGAITRLPDLLKAADDAGLWDRPVVQDAARTVVQWPVLVRRILDESRPSEVPWTKAPGGLRCPHCASTLMLAPGWQYNAEQADVICPNTACRDEDGTRRRYAPSAWLGRLMDDTIDREMEAAERAAARNPERLVTAREAVTVWDLASPDHVYVWKHRGRITPAGVDRTGREVYRNGDIAALLDLASQRAGAPGSAA